MRSRRKSWSILILAACTIPLGCASPQNKNDKSKTVVDLNEPESNSPSKDKNNEFNETNAGSENTAAGRSEIHKSGDETNQVPSSDLYHKFDEARSNHQLRSAQEAAGELLARNPGDPKVLNGLTALAIEQDRFDLAKLLISKVLEKSPNNSAANNNLGVVDLRTGNLRLALGDFKKAIQLDPSNKFAHANLGSIYLQYRNYQSASTEFQAAVDHGDQSTATLSNLGFALTGVNKYDEAAASYEKALVRESSNPSVMLNYAALLIEHAGKKEQGVKLLNKIRFVAHEPAILEKAEVLAKMAENTKKISPEKESPIEEPVK